MGEKVREIVCVHSPTGQWHDTVVSVGGKPVACKRVVISIEVQKPTEITLTLPEGEVRLNGFFEREGG